MSGWCQVTTLFYSCLSKCLGLLIAVLILKSIIRTNPHLATLLACDFPLVLKSSYSQWLGGKKTKGIPLFAETWRVDIVWKLWGCTSKLCCYSLCYGITVCTQSLLETCCLNSCLRWEDHIVQAAFECLSIWGCIVCSHLLCCSFPHLLRRKWWCDPLNQRHCEMHGPLLEVQLQTSFSICYKLTLLHIKPIHLYLKLWALLLSRLCVCVYTRCFSHPPCDLTLSSGFRLLKRDGFTGALIMPCQAEMFIEGCSMYLQKHNLPLKKCPVYVFFNINPFSLVFIVIESVPRTLYFL